MLFEMIAGEFPSHLSGKSANTLGPLNTAFSQSKESKNYLLPILT